MAPSEHQTWNFIGIAAMDATIAVHAVFTRG